MITLQELRSRTQAHKLIGKTAKHHVGYIWHRRLSIYVTYALVRWFPWCSANMVSVSMIVVAGIGTWLVSVQDPLWQIAGLGLFYVSFLLDKVDGEVARYHNQSTLRGAYLDEWYHVLVPTGLLAGLFAGLAYDHSFLMTLILLLALVLMLVRRVERKWYLTIGSKRRAEISAGSINSQVPTMWVLRLVNTFPFKLTSVVERFDLWLLGLVVVIGLEYIGVLVVPLLSVLVVYTIFSTVYAFRFFVINYFGHFDRVTRAFVRDGF